jgi:hypothetical protein
MGAITTRKETMSDLLRYVYTDEMREQFSRRSVLMQEFPRKNIKTMADGKGIVVKAHVGGGGGYMFTSDLSTAPASKQDVRQLIYDYHISTSSLEIAGDLMVETSDKAAAEKEILDFELQGVIKDNGPLTNFLMYGNGDGKMAGVSSASAATTMIVDNARGFMDNVRIDVLLTSSGEVGYGVRAAQCTVNHKSHTITLSGTSVFTDWAGLNSNAADYTVYLHNSRNDAIYGLSALISDSNPPTGVANIGGIDRDLAINTWFKAQVFDNGGALRRPTLPLIQDAIDAIDDYADSEAKLILCGNRVWSYLASQLIGNKSYQGELMNLHGWASAINFVNTPIVKDKHCPPDKMFILDPALFRIWQLNEGQWMDDDGSILSRVQGKIAYEATWWKKWQLVPMKPIGTAVITDLAQDLPEG